MHSGVISLLVLVATLQMICNEAGAQVVVENPAGMRPAQSAAAYSPLGVQRSSQYYPPAIYPPYPVHDGYPYDGSSGIIASIFRFIKFAIWKIISFPLSCLSFFKNVIVTLFGFGTDYGYYPIGYPYASASALF